MAQIENTSRSRSAKGRKVRKAIFVDLTPMVDLAFLLITFFMLTTSMMKPFVMDLAMPKDTDQTVIPASCVITFIAGGDDVLWFYYGFDSAAMTQTNYSSSGMRSLIYDKMELLRKTTGKDIICLLKLTDDANYQNMVDLLDEMNVTGVKTYAIQKLLPEELSIISQLSIKK